METGQIVIDQSVFVTALIFVFGALLSFTVALLVVFGLYLIKSFDKKLESCNKIVSDKIDMVIKSQDELRDSINHSHDRISDHVTKLHT